MPLVIMSGFPASGKTTRAKEIKKYFEDQSVEVHIVGEEEQIQKAGFDKNSVYLDASKEKHIRGLLKSEVLRLIGPKSLVILDGSNYIKGYRYELYCASKANKSTQCTIQTVIHVDQAWQQNESRSDEKYTRQVFDALVNQYEEPNANNRWDSPLISALAEGSLDLSAINSYLFEKKPPPPNQSTQNPPLSATNFLHDLDKITKDITDCILKAKNRGERGEFYIPGHDRLCINLSSINAAQLVMLRRQYLTYSKMHAPEVDKIAQLYIQYLRTTLT